MPDPARKPFLSFDGRGLLAAAFALPVLLFLLPLVTVLLIAYLLAGLLLQISIWCLWLPPVL